MASGRAAVLRGIFGNMLDDVLKVVDEPITRGQRTLTPNAVYTTGKPGTTGSYHYSTDGEGRIASAHARPMVLDKTKRASHEPNPQGKGAGDDAGHLFGDRFGGSPRRDNIVAQLSSVNRGAYKKMENNWDRLLSKTPPAHIEVDIEVDYGRDGRPIGFFVTEVVDGVETTHQFRN